MPTPQEYSYNKLILCVSKRDANFDGKALFIYIKMDEQFREYALFLRFGNDRRTLYTHSPFFVKVLNEMTMLMCEYGIGSDWNIIEYKD